MLATLHPSGKELDNDGGLLGVFGYFGGYGALNLFLPTISGGIMPDVTLANMRRSKKNRNRYCTTNIWQEQRPIVMLSISDTGRVAATVDGWRCLLVPQKGCTRRIAASFLQPGRSSL